jgi:FkbM family methyltransferase
MKRLAGVILQNSKAAQRIYSDFKFLNLLPFSQLVKAVALLPFSKSQLRQDLFVLTELSFKRSGYYVEFGATDGVHLNNTYLLEKRFSWFGILAEPAKHWHKSLASNRPKSLVENLCVWRSSDETLEFNEANNRELSTIQQFASDHVHGESRITSNCYPVNTISLIDLLQKYNSPSHIDYLSIDTEGSEHEILQAFDFSRYSFGVITVEHNYTDDRERIHTLLTKNGYARIHERASGFDDWYVKVDRQRI